MALRNFWVDCYIDGKETPISSGPRSKDGGMEIIVSQRCDGESKAIVKIVSQPVVGTDEIVTVVKDHDNNVIKEIKTNR